MWNYFVILGLFGDEIYKVCAALEKEQEKQLTNGWHAVTEMIEWRKIKNLQRNRQSKSKVKESLHYTNYNLIRKRKGRIRNTYRTVKHILFQLQM